YKLILEAATYRDTHQSSACVSEPSSIPANARHLELSVTSVPEGAEIWIRDEKLGNNTNAVVSVPYTYDVPITVVVAKPGYAVWAGTLVPPFPPRSDIRCTFVRPGATGRKARTKRRASGTALSRERRIRVASMLHAMGWKCDLIGELVESRRAVDEIRADARE